MREENYWTRSMRRRWGRRRFLGAAGGLAAGAAAFTTVGCGDDDDEPDASADGGDSTQEPGASASPTTTTETGASASPAAPRQGGSLTYAGREDPIWASSPYGRTALSGGLWVNLHDTLVRYESRDLTPSPRLAESYEFNGDETELVLTLRPGLAFWDGSPITAEKVAENFTAIGAKDTPNSQSRGIVAAYVESAEATDDTHLRLTLKRPGTPVFDALNFLPIIDTSTIPDAVEGRPWNGSGPYKIVDPKPQEGATLEAHREFWKPLSLDKIDYRVYTDTSSLDLAVETGEVDFTFDLTADSALRFRDRDDFQYMQERMGQLYVLGMRVTSDVVGDPRIRRALYKSIDRERIVEDVFGGVSEPATQIWPPESPAYNPDSGLGAPFDLDAARQLVTEAGYPDGTPSIEITTRNSQTEVVRYLELIQSDAKQAGINIDLAPADSSTFSEQFQAASYKDCYSTGFGFYDYHPDSLMVMNYQARVPNSAAFEAPEYIQLLDDLENATSADQRKELYDTFNRIWEEQLWVVPICVRMSQWVASKHVAGLRLDPLTGMAVMEELSRA